MSGLHRTSSASADDATGDEITTAREGDLVIDLTDPAEHREVPQGELVVLPVDHVGGPFGDRGTADIVERSTSRSLRRILVTGDVLAVTLSWAAAATMPGLVPVPATFGWIALVVGVASASQLVAMAAQKLYLSRVSTVRSIELVRLSRAAVIAGVTALIFADVVHVNLGLRRALLGGVLSFFVASVCRGVYGSWLRAGRARGLYSRDVVVVGANDEGLQLYNLLETHPEAGMRVCGVVGDRAEYEDWPRSVPFLGVVDQTLQAVAGTQATGVLIASSALGPSELNAVSRQLLDHNVHVQLSSGLRGISHQRLRALPLAHEPLYYLEPVRLSRAQIVVKRLIDVVIATLALVVFAPVMLLAALAVKLGDRGPIFFRQERVGRDGERIHVLKFRTMVPNAEQMLDEVKRMSGNQRESILFKLDRDPRRTRVGRYLEAASLDELPQLFNVLGGSMSLVGPRPALPREVDQFDDELLARLSVPPGITGLWQVEARDNPSFEAYRRLDLFYVENWSVTLDLVLLMETATSVGARLFRSRHFDDGAAEAESAAPLSPAPSSPASR